MKNDCLSKSFEIRAKGGFFQRQSTDKVTLGVSLFVSVGHISSIGCRYKGDGDLKVS